MTTPDPIITSATLQREKTDAIIQQAAKRTAGFTGENTDTGADTDNGKQKPGTLTRAEVVKMTPRARMEFFKNGGKFKDA